MIALITTLWFWIIIAEIVFTIICIENERGILAGSSLFVTAALLYWVAGVDFITYFATHKSQLFWGIALYFPIGFAWAIIKWVIFVLNKKEKHREMKLEFFEQFDRKLHNITATANTPMNYASVASGSISQHTLDIWRKKYGLESRAPKASCYKENILRWIGFWPVSMLWTMINDLVNKIAKTIYNFTSNIFQFISNKLYSNVE